MMKAVYSQLEPVPGVSLQQQITTFLRSLIHGGQLAHDERLPNVRDLADAWATSHYTVQAAITPLVKEGLIARRPRLGTYVKAPRLRLTTIGVYHNHRPLPSTDDAFSTAIQTAVCRRLLADGIRVLPWFDLRAEKDQSAPLREVADAIRCGQAQGIIATSVRSANLDWLQRYQVPFSAVTTQNIEGGVGTDSGQMVAAALRDLAAKGCRQVGMITHVRPPEARPDPASAADLLLHEAFHREAARLQMAVDPAWIKSPETHPDGFEKAGYDLFHQLWQEPEHPDGLLVFPDVLARGVFQAVLELRVQVPAELRLAVHRNSEIDLFSPFDLTWIEVAVQDFADALFDQVERLFRGEPAPYRKIQLETKPHIPGGLQ